MISYKYLIILTVLFEIIIFSNGERTNKEIEECMSILQIMGFRHENGFYNFNYVLQFETYEEFIEHMKTRVIIVNGNIKAVTEKADQGTLVDSENPESTKSDKNIETNKDTDNNTILQNEIGHAKLGTTQDDGTSIISEDKITDTAIVNNVTLPETITGSLNTIYTNINNIRTSSQLFLIEKFIKTPNEYCNFIMLETYYTVRQTYYTDKESGKKQNEVKKYKKKMPALIEECTSSILAFKYDRDGPVFKYDGNNRYKCLLTTYDITVFYVNKGDKSIFKKLTSLFQNRTAKVTSKDIQEKPIFKAMSEFAMDYFRYHMEVIDEWFNKYPELVPNKWCRL